MYYFLDVFYGADGVFIVPVLCFVFGLMVAEGAETCRRTFNIDYQYMLCLLTE
jgi:hypothetical protein